jgi:hypothetical protein
VVDAALGDQVEDPFQGQGGVDGCGDLVEDAQLLDRPLQAQVLAVQAQVLFQKVLAFIPRVFVNDFNDKLFFLQPGGVFQAGRGGAARNNARDASLPAGFAV